MDVTREVILDLLPPYLAGEASADTRALVEEYLARDAELARVVREQRDGGLDAASVAPPPDVELKSLRRTRRLIGYQRWLFGLALAFTALALTSEFSFEGGRLKEFHFLVRDYPAQFGSFAALAVACWLAYFAARRRLRATAL